MYDGPDGKEAVNPRGGEDTTDIYVIPYDDGWWIVNAKAVTETFKESWVEMVNEGDARIVRVAGPFEKLDSAKAAWRLMYG